MGYVAETEGVSATFPDPCSRTLRVSSPTILVVTTACTYGFLGRLDKAEHALGLDDSTWNCVLNLYLPV